MTETEQMHREVCYIGYTLYMRLCRGRRHVTFDFDYLSGYSLAGPTRVL